MDTSLLMTRNFFLKDNILDSLDGLTGGNQDVMHGLEEGSVHSGVTGYKLMEPIPLATIDTSDQNQSNNTEDEILHTQQVVNADADADAGADSNPDDPATNSNDNMTIIFIFLLITLIVLLFSFIIYVMLKKNNSTNIVVNRPQKIPQSDEMFVQTKTSSLNFDGATKRSLIYS